MSAASWDCTKPFGLLCTEHGEQIQLRCKRWRSCRGCAMWKQWQLTTRFLAGVTGAPEGLHAMFFTLTFPRSAAPTEDEAHASLRRLVVALRREDRLDQYGWVLQRQRNGTLHYHGIAWMPWMDDGLQQWRALVVRSGFGPQQRLEVAKPAHARYCCRYISTNLAALAPAKRAYSFSRGFPQPAASPPDPMEATLAALGFYPEACEWVPASWLSL